MLYLVDDWDHSSPDDVQAQFAGQPVSVVCGDDVAWLKSLDEWALDWVYIDTLHNYAQTNRELDACRGKVSQIVAGHDWCCTSCMHTCPCVDEWVRDGGAMRAVIEHIQAGWLELIGLTVPDESLHPSDHFPSWACRVTRCAS